jgi:hypothetical protein
MNWEPDLQLEEQFLRLLREADASTSNQAGVAQDFARRLASFADAWATNDEAIDEYEQRLAEWIDSIKSRSLMTAEESALPAYERQIEIAGAED